MIDEYWTWRCYGYHSDELSYGSAKRIIAVCDECGKYRSVIKFAYSDLCISCVQSGERHWSFGLRGKDHPNFGKHRTDEVRLAISERTRGEKNPFFGKHHSEETKRKLAERVVTDETRQKISDNHADVNGCNNPAWKGGVSSWKAVLMKSQLYKNWRKAIFTRDHHTCQMCNDNTGGNLQAHHIHPIRDHKNDLSMFDINNGITLCKQCHESIYKREYDFIEQFENILRGI